VSEPLRIAIAGLGTVGAGTLRLLLEQKTILEARAGRKINVVAVSSRDRHKDRGLSLEGIEWFDDPVDMAETVRTDIIIETIGGSEGPALDLARKSLSHRRHLVTANKALIAHHGSELATLAENNGVQLSFEAAVAGGIPILKAIREGLVGNQLTQVYGILNGTCNYILSTMRETGRDFVDVLSEAQTLGYAETDPSFDIDGIDTAHKIAILSSLAFGLKIDFSKSYIEGIRHISALDIRFAEELGYRIKLLGIARKTETGIEQRVHPCMVPLSSSISHIDNVYNAVVCEGDFVGRSLYEGRGAGSGPTSSAILSDIVDIAKSRFNHPFGLAVRNLNQANISSMSDYCGAYYMRLMVLDKPGVFAMIAKALHEEDVSMEAILQRAKSPGDIVPVVLTMHNTKETSMQRALDKIASLDAVIDPPRLIRIENF
jgi:homoserine dehydrogenase